MVFQNQYNYHNLQYKFNHSSYNNTLIWYMWESFLGHCSTITILALKWCLSSKEHSIVLGFMSQNL